MAESFDFEALEALRNYLASIRRNHVPTMNHYASDDAKGFWHQPTKRSEASLSSTATCVSSLIRAGLWLNKDRSWGKTADVAKRLLQEPWESAGLKKNNPFGLSFIAEGVLDLAQADAYDGHAKDIATVHDTIVPILLKEVMHANSALSVPGSVSIRPYPPSAYLTQLAFRVLRRCFVNGGIGDKRKSDQLVLAVRAWARSEIHRQVALISTGSRIADPMQLAYAIVLASSASIDEQTSPEEKALVRSGLKVFFGTQQWDGNWPPSQPLFHYPDVGNALCFDYELLTQLLSCSPLQDELLEYLPQLRAAALQLQHTSFDLGSSTIGSAVGWASGHHPQIEGPESWSTACVYDFIHALDRLVAEAIRRNLFKELRSVYTPPERGTKIEKKADDFAPGFLDAEVRYGDGVHSLRQTLWRYFVQPLDRDKSQVANGGSLKRETPMSAILFGPPGTSKTQLAKMISRFLGWPLLSVDPSYLVQDGLDHLYFRANRLFSMLTMAEQIVVLLDEFDEMGRDREKSTELLSRLITTSMLPKLAAINEERKIVFLLATNYVSDFDAAFSRGGRFDMILQVMPPSAESKLTFPPWSDVLKASLEKMPPKKNPDAMAMLADLTYLETQDLVFALKQKEIDPLDEFTKARDRGTLNKDGAQESWKVRSGKEAKIIRLPPVQLQD